MEASAGNVDLSFFLQIMIPEGKMGAQYEVTFFDRNTQRQIFKIHNL